MISTKIKVRGLFETITYLIVGRGFEIVAMSSDVRDALLLLPPGGPELAKALAEILSINTYLRPEVPSPFRHWSLSAPNGVDNSANWEVHTKMLLAEHGVEPDTHSFIAIRHLDQSTDHIHPVYCRISHAGALVRDSWRDCGISQKVCRTIEEQYGMPTLTSSVAEKKPTVRKPKKGPRTTRSESEMQKRGVPSKKVQAVQALDAAWPKEGEVLTYAGFCEQLAEAGIEIILNRRGTSVGVTYLIHGHPWKSSTLGDRYQWRGIEPHILRAVSGDDAEAAGRNYVPKATTSVFLPTPPPPQIPAPKKRSGLPNLPTPINLLSLVEDAYERTTIFQREAERNRKEGGFRTVGPRDRGVPWVGGRPGHRGYPRHPR